MRKAGFRYNRVTGGAGCDYFKMPQLSPGGDRAMYRGGDASPPDEADDAAGNLQSGSSLDTATQRAVTPAS